MQEYLVGFKYTSGVLISRHALERVAYEVRAHSTGDAIVCGTLVAMPTI